MRTMEEILKFLDSGQELYEGALDHLRGMGYITYTDDRSREACASAYLFQADLLSAKIAFIKSIKEFITGNYGEV